MIKKPCSICNHGKRNHLSFACLDCYEFNTYLADYQQDSYKPFQHKYEMDNLKYLEKCYDSKN